MSREEHIARHKLLHEMFDELGADYLQHHDGALPSNTSMVDLMMWSYQQTLDPISLTDRAFRPPAWLKNGHVD